MKMEKSPPLAQQQYDLAYKVFEEIFFTFFDTLLLMYIYYFSVNLQCIVVQSYNFIFKGYHHESVLV